MKIIGLTGSIASGKSVASSYILKKGYAVVDADMIAHKVTEKGNQGLLSVLEKFGSDILLEDGNLDRKKLSDIVFSDKNKLKLLNETLHPIIFENIDKAISEYKNEDFVFLDAPLLFETGLDKKCSLVLLITTDEKTQIERIMKRDSVDEKKALSVIKNQMPKEEKEKRSDVIIDNSSSIDQFTDKLDVFLENLKKGNI